jgi:hypothetical protein
MEAVMGMMGGYNYFVKDGTFFNTSPANGAPNAPTLSREDVLTNGVQQADVVCATNPKIQNSMFVYHPQNDPGKTNGIKISCSQYRP